MGFRESSRFVEWVLTIGPQTKTVNHLVACSIPARQPFNRQPPVVGWVRIFPILIFFDFGRSDGGEQPIEFRACRIADGK